LNGRDRKIRQLGYLPLIYIQERAGGPELISGNHELAGSNATFVVSATTPPLAYQWRFNGTNLSGATNSAYTRSNVQRTNAGNYSVAITNAFGGLSSSNALLAVTPVTPVTIGSISVLPDGRVFYVMKFVEGAKVSGGQHAYSKKEAMDHFRRAAEVSTKPFIYLSAGVSNPEFTEALELAAEAGTKFSGVLCGRATWKDGIAVFGKQGGAAFRKWLEDEGVKNIQNVNDRLKAAHPWFEFYGAKSADALA